MNESEMKDFFDMLLRHFHLNRSDIGIKFTYVDLISEWRAQRRHMGHSHKLDKKCIYCLKAEENLLQNKELYNKFLAEGVIK